MAFGLLCAVSFSVALSTKTFAVSPPPPPPPPPPSSFSSFSPSFHSTSISGTSNLNRSVDWWLGSYTSAFVEENTEFIRSNPTAITGVFHCCRGVRMLSNGSLTQIESDGIFFQNLTAFEVKQGLDPVLVPISPNTDALLAGLASNAITELVQMSVERGFDGYVVDYEPHANLTTTHVKLLTAFLKALTAELHASKKMLSICVSDWGIIGPQYYPLLATTGADRFVSMGSTYKNHLMIKLNVQAMLKAFPLPTITIGLGTMVPAACDCVYGNTGNCTGDYEWDQADLNKFVEWVGAQGITRLAIWRADIYPAYCKPVGVEPWFMQTIKSFLHPTTSTSATTSATTPTNPMI